MLKDLLNLIFVTRKMNNNYYFFIVLSSKYIKKVYLLWFIFKNSKPKVKTYLTSNEIKILSLMAQGKEDFEIAKNIHLSTYTTKMHIRKIYKKLKVKNSRKAVEKAIKQDLIDI